MDQKLLDALNNISIALEQLSESLDKSKSPVKSDVGNSLQSGDFSKQLVEINEGIKSIKEDTKKILDNQETIIKLQKQQTSGESKIFEEAGGGKTKQMIKDGVAVIGLIAGAILAIGLAFKLIGSVDFVSVLAIAFALPLMAEAFARISKVEGFDAGKIVGATVALVAMSFAIMVSSRILAGVVPVGLFQLITVVFIAAAFGAAAVGLGFLLNALGKIDPAVAIQGSFLLPIVLIATSIAIAASSVILQAVVPIGLFQALTAILISAAFGVMAYGIGKLIESFKGIDPATAAIAAASIPIVLIALSLAIVGASIYFQAIVPIGLFQTLTAILISATFVVLSYAVKPLLSGLKDVNYEDITKGTIVILALTAAVTLASWILMGMAPVEISSIFKFLLLSASISLSVVVLALAVKAVNKIGDVNEFIKGGKSILVLASTIMLASLILSLGSYEKFPDLMWGMSAGISILAFGLLSFSMSKLGSPGDFIKGGISIAVIATVIMLTSRILSLGDYSDYPNLSWALGVGLSLVGFGMAALVLGLIVSTGAGAVVLAAGALAIVGIAGTIVAVDKILSGGDYTKYPGLDWAKGVGTSLILFGTAVVLLGVVNSVGGIASTLSLGLVENPIDAGIEAVLLIAMSIPIVDKMISSGDYTKYPGLEWSSGVGMSLIAFSMGIMVIGGIDSDTLEVGISSIKGIAQTISDISFTLATGDYKGGPTKEWSSGISLALGAFLPVYGMLMANKILFGGVGPKEFSDAINTITDGIIISGQKFAGVGDIWSGGPTESWVRGVGGALSAFTPVFEVLAKSSGIFSSGPSVGDMKGAILMITEGLIESANIFSKSNASFLNPPPEEWVRGVSGSIQAFVPVFELLSGKSISPRRIKSTLKSIGESINEISLEISKGDYTKYPKPEWIDGTIYALQKFQDIISLLNFSGLGSGGIMGSISSFFGGKTPLEQAVSNITMLAIAFDKLGSTMNKFSNSIQGLDVEKLSLVKGMSSNMIMLSLMDPDMLEDVLSRIEEKGGVFAELIKDFEDQKSESGGGSTVRTPSSGGSSDPNLQELQKLGKKLDNMTGILASISSVVSGDLRNYLMDNSTNERNIQVSPSDMRLKNIIRKIGTSPLGINIYEFTYKFNSHQLYVGVIAQELIGTEFECALVNDKNGYYAVDYSKIDVKFSKLNK